jgi:hypothetical protein
VLASDLPATVKLTAWAILETIESGERPSVEILAKATSQSERTVQYAIRALKDLGWLKTKERYRGNLQQRNAFLLRPPLSVGCSKAPPDGRLDS